MRLLMQFSACLGLGLVVAVMILIGLMFVGWFDVIDGLLMTGKPLASLSLMVLPEGFWSSLTGCRTPRTTVRCVPFWRCVPHWARSA